MGDTMRNLPINNSGKAPLHQKWVEKEFVFDTMHMHWQARLYYRALLQSAWHLSTRPDLPDDDAQLRSILGGVPEEQWNEHREVVRAMFTAETVNGIKVLSQKRLRRDWQTIEEYRERQSALANRRWNKSNKKQAHAKAMPTRMPRQSQANAEAMPSRSRSRSRGIGNENGKREERPNVETAPSPNSNSKPKHDRQELEHDGRRVVEWIMERAQALDKRASFTKTAKADLLEALRKLGPVSKKELEAVIKDRVELCRDDVAFSKFGTDLAANLVSSIRTLRRQLDAEKQNRKREKWFDEFQAQRKNPKIDEWLAENPVPPDFAASLPSWLAEIRKEQAEDAEREACDAEPQLSAQELFGGTEQSSLPAQP
jgi:uncharacterized protein YdaU (DUF1376 family)